VLRNGERRTIKLTVAELEINTNWSVRT
jgi:hypothetical protein